MWAQLGERAGVEVVADADDWAEEGAVGLGVVFLR